MILNNDWRTPGRSRLLFGTGGAFSMATMILSGHYDPAYPPATQFLIDMARPKTLIRLTRKLNCNWLIATAGHGFPPEDERLQEEWLAEVVEEAHRHGIAVLPYISLTNIYRDRFERLHPECKTWYAQDIHGNEVPYAAGKYIPGRRPPRLMACLSSEGWWQYLCSKMDRVADTGVDGLYYDNIFSTCFCPRCQKAYADFTEQKIGQRLVFQQMHTFDRGSYMSGGIEVIAKQEQSSDAALLEEQFRLGQIVDLLTRLKQRFFERTGKSIMVCNAHNRPMLNDVTEIILTEDGSEPGVLWAADFPSFQRRNKGFPGLGEQLPEGQPFRLVTNAGLYKYMAADGGYDKLWTNFQHPLRYLGDPAEPMKPKSWQRSIAEAHAFGGDYLIVNTHFFLPALEEPAIMDAVVRYHRFLARYRDLWDAIYPVADTLVPAWSIGVQERALSELALENYPFEVVPALQVNEETLSRIKTILFLEEAAVKQVDKGLLTRFTQRGGNVLLLGLDGALLSDLPDTGVTLISEISAEKLVQDPSAAALLKRELIRLNGQPQWEVSGKRGVVCNLARNGTGDRMVLYAVNLWDEPVHNIQVTVRGCPSATPRVTAYSPDGRVRFRRLRATVDQDGTVTFTIPQVAIYTAVEIAGGRSSEPDHV